jgi:hypothetical protein
LSDPLTLPDGRYELRDGLLVWEAVNAAVCTHAEFKDKILRTEPGDQVFIAHPHVLGSDYETVMASLRQLSERQIRLTIARHSS